VSPSPDPDERAVRLCIVGSGTTFLSGISYYTYFLASCLDTTFTTSVILMRRLVPRFMYPGADRVGAAITDLDASKVVPTFDGVDWYSPRSILRAGRFLEAHSPDVIVFQWWTGAVLPAYLYLARRTRTRGGKIVIEFHEDQDTGEASLPLVERLVRPGLRWLIGAADGYVVHSEWDRDRLSAKLGIDPHRVRVVLHGPYPMAGTQEDAPVARTPADPVVGSDDGRQVVTVLFFGTIRPYKGLEDLVDAFDLLPREDVDWRLLVIGETWEGWNLPAEKIAASRHRADIDFINRYVTDDELRSGLDRADIAALPYTRSSASGPLHIVMQRGLPVVISDVGGLSEAAGPYAGAAFVPPSDPPAIASALVAALPDIGLRYPDPHSWESTRDGYRALVENLLATPSAEPTPG